MERDVVIEAKGGNKDAFSSLVTGYLPRLYVVAYSFLRNVDDAADACQETFLKVYRNLYRFDEDRSFYPWIYRILKNVCLNQLKKRKRAFNESDGVEELPSHYKAPEKLLMEKEDVSALLEAIKRLPEHHREILVLKEWGGASYREMAEMLSIPEGTVMSRLFNARQALKEALNQEGRESLSWNAKMQK